MGDLALLQGNALGFLLRWFHLLGGVAWVGLLWYFNFLQGEYFKEADPAAKADAQRKLAPRALWWFRWGAMLTFLTGIGLLGVKQLSGYGILVGAVLGTLMFLNAWLIIWPKQKIVIASAEQVAAGGDPDPAADGALAKAGLASRTNTLFSIPMLFFMASSVHLAQLSAPITSASILSLAVTFGLIALLQANALAGKAGPMSSVKGVIHMGVLLTLVLYLAVDLL
jgi:uncharacterized membrane protein